MIHSLYAKHGLFFRRCASGILVPFVCSCLLAGPVPAVRAQDLPGVMPLPSTQVRAGGVNLPTPGSMLEPSPDLEPPILIGLTVHPENPFYFEFILDTGAESLSAEELADESERLIRYFLAGLTINEDDLWVNLSPDERDRIVPEAFGMTEMGRDMLAQDYILKQIAASFIYPEHDTGRGFWEKLHQKTYETYGRTDIEHDMFNKFWIVPETARIYQGGHTAIIAESRLKVLLDHDYQRSQDYPDPEAGLGNGGAASDGLSELRERILQERVLPELAREVNEGAHFAALRQIYHSLILAFWFKQNLRESIWEQVYIGKNKVSGVDIEETDAAREIYDQYVSALEKGVFDYIRDDLHPWAGEVIPRKYFSGGMVFGAELKNVITTDPAMLSSKRSKLDKLAGEGRIVKVSSGVVVSDEPSVDPDNPYRYRSVVYDNPPYYLVHLGARYVDGEIQGGQGLLNPDGFFDRKSVNDFLAELSKGNPHFNAVIQNVPLSTAGGLVNFYGQDKIWTRRKGYERENVTVVIENGKVSAVYDERGERLFPFGQNFVYPGVPLTDGHLPDDGLPVNPEGAMDRQALNRLLAMYPGFTGVIDRVKLDQRGGLGRIARKSYWMSMAGFGNAYVRLEMQDGIVAAAFAENGTRLYPFLENYIYRKAADGEHVLETQAGLADRHAVNRWLKGHPGFTGVIRRVPLDALGGLVGFNNKPKDFYWLTLPGYEKALVSIFMERGEVIEVRDAKDQVIYPFNENLVYEGGAWKDGKVVGGRVINPGGTKTREGLNKILEENPGFTGVIAGVILGSKGGLVDFNGRKAYWTGRKGYEKKPVSLIMRDGELVEAVAEDGTVLFPFEDNVVYEGADYENGNIVGGKPGVGFIEREALNRFIEQEGEDFSGVVKTLLTHRGGLVRPGGRSDEFVWRTLSGFENAHAYVVMKEGQVIKVYSMDHTEIYPFKENDIYLNAELESGEIIGGELITENGLQTRKFLNQELAEYPEFTGVIRNVRLSPIGTIGVLKGRQYTNRILGYENELADIVMVNDQAVAAYHHETGKVLWAEDKMREAEKILNTFWENGDLKKLVELFGQEGTQRIMFNFLGDITPQQIMQMSKKFMPEIGRRRGIRHDRRALRGLIRKLSAVSLFSRPASVELESVLGREIFFIVYGYIVRDYKFIELIKQEVAEGGLNPMLRRIFQSVIQEIEGIHAFEIKGIKATTKLKFYQRAGIKFILDKQRVLLGDRPGLGKTVQALGAAVNAFGGRGAHKVLIISPKISISNVWKRQIHKHLKGEQKIYVVRTRADLRDRKKLEQMRASRFVIINYEIVRGEEAADLRALLKTEGFDFIIADEAHRMRNETQVSEAVLEFDAPYKVLVTASAQKGRTIGKIFNLLHWLRPEQYRDRREFLKRYSSPEGFRQLKQELNAFTIRRYVADVLMDMPDLEIVHHVVQMSGEQARLYREIEQAFLENLGKSGNFIDFSYLTYLRKAALDTSLIREVVATNMATGEVQRLIPGVSVFRAGDEEYVFRIESGHATGQFSSRSDVQADPVAITFEQGAVLMEMSSVPYQFELRERESYSAKYEALDSIVHETVIENQEKLAVFTGFVKTAEDLRKRYQDQGIRVFMITGSGVQSPIRRKRIIDELQNSPDPMILISTYQTTGESIDLIGARYGVLVDSPWMDRDQIVRRLFRLGQEGDVHFTVMISRNSIDEHIEQVNWEAEMVQKIVLDDVSSLYKENAALMSLYISAGADRGKERRQMEAFRKKIKGVNLFTQQDQRFERDVLEIMRWGEYYVQYSRDKQLEAHLRSADGKDLNIKNFQDLFYGLESLTRESKDILRDFFRERFLSEHEQKLPVKDMVLWGICESLIPGFKNIDYDGRVEFIVELGTYIIRRLIEDPGLRRDAILDGIEDVPEQLYEQTLYYLDSENIFKLFSLMGVIPQAYFYEGALLKYNPPIRIFYLNGGLQYFDERVVSSIAPGWRVDEQGRRPDKSGFERSAEEVRPLSESEEKRLANQVRMGNKAAEQVLVGSRLRDIVKIAKRVKPKVEGILGGAVRGSIDLNRLYSAGQVILYDLIRSYAKNEIYYNQALGTYLQERLNPRLYTEGFIAAKEIMDLQGDRPIFDGGSRTLLDVQADTSPDVSEQMEGRENIDVLKRLLKVQGFSALEQDLIVLFVFDSYSVDELADEYAENKGRDPAEQDHDEMQDLIERFQSSMADFGKEAVLKMFREGGAPSGDGDAAMLTDVGGIDLRPDGMRLQVSGYEALLPFPTVFLEDLDVSTFPGFTPVIIEITPVNNLLMILGHLDVPYSEEQKLSRYHP